MYLHNDIELFKDIITTTTSISGISETIIEKDYYISLILKQLSLIEPDAVFKGGTSLSKCFHVINRFSEDIDITFTKKLSQGQRKKLKYEVIGTISENLNLPISNWEQTRSRRNLNSYYFEYQSIYSLANPFLTPCVKLETALASRSFPVITKEVDSIIWQYLHQENKDLLIKYNLIPFSMKLQSLERTLIDKVFAICDYYLKGNIVNKSRHIYDIYFLLNDIKIDEKFFCLIPKIRAERAVLDICPSAKSEVNLQRLLQEVVQQDVYKTDYEQITSSLMIEKVAYNTAIQAVKQIIELNCF